MMVRKLSIDCLEWLIRSSGRVKGNGRFPMPSHCFQNVKDPDQAEARLEAIHEQFLAWLQPPQRSAQAFHSFNSGITSDGYLEWSFDSPRPSGVPNNDRARARWLGNPEQAPQGQCLIFHHAVYQDSLKRWEWFLAPLAAHYPILFVEAPWHFNRTPAGERAGERTVSPNPYNLYTAVRQWIAEQPTWTQALKEHGLNPVAQVGFSLGAFQTILASAAGVLNQPLVSIAPTNNYAWGLTQGCTGGEVIQAMESVGIDKSRLQRMVRSAQLDRYASRVKSPVLLIEGAWDRVDPPPSIDRLKASLRPKKSISLPGGHGTLLLFRKRIAHEVCSFLDNNIEMSHPFTANVR